MLSHKNVIACVSGCLKQLGSSHSPRNSDVMISYLPMAHMLERLVQTSVIANGGAIGFASGHIRNLTDDMKVLQPTIMPTVPRILNRVYDRYTIYIYITVQN